MPRAPRTVLLRMSVETAKRTRKCSRNKSHLVRPGEKLLLVSERGPAAGQKGYCAVCATEMLTAAQRELDDLEDAVNVAQGAAEPA